MKAENRGNEGFLQRASVEHQGYAEARSTDRSEGKERDGASGLLEAILDRDNLNRAYKRVKSNHGAAGIDGMSVEEALPWLKEHREELLQSIRDGSYEPSPVRRKEIPKPDGGVRKLGIPTVVDRVIQQGIAQKLQNIWEPQFSDSSYGYRPKRSGQQAIQKVKEYAEAGYRYAVSVDLSKYFDTLNHELLMNLLHRKIQDMRVLRIIKKYLKSGVMENGVVCKTEEGSPQGGPLSPLLANIYLNEFDWEMHSRGVKTVRYADDIVVFAKSKRAAERLLESSRRYLEGKLKLKMNTEKSKVTSIFAVKEFKFLGFCLGKNGKRHLHPCAPKVAEQGKGKAETTDKTQPRTQRPPSDGGSKSVHPRMDRVLPCSRDEADDEVLGRMAAAQVPNVHLEAVEEAPNEGSQFKEAGNPGGQGVPVGQFPIGLLANRRKPSFSMFHYKRKTRSSRIF